MALCWGWIDAVRKGSTTGASSALHPARRGALWSRINVDNVARLIDEGRMTEHGLHAGRGRQGRRPLGPRLCSGRDMAIPDDLQAASTPGPRRRTMLARLNAQNRFAIAFRLHNMKTEAGRAQDRRLRRDAQRGETIYPQ